MEIMGIFALDLSLAEVRACYYGDWARYRSGGAKLSPGDIDPFVCTHIIVSFLKVTSDYNLVPFDADSASQVYPVLAGLKAQNPNLKILAAVGGATHDNQLFTSMTSTSSGRNTFSYNVVSFLRQYNFDGLDVDWEFPYAAGKTGFTNLLSALYNRFSTESSGLSRLLLTVAVSASSAISDASYSYYDLNQYADYVFLMSYDFHGSWNTETGHNSPLHASSADTLAWQQEFNMAWIADFWTGKGISADKLVVGFATYGRTFTLSNSYNHGVGAPASSGPGGQYLGQNAYMAYFEVCDEIRAGAVRYWDGNSKVPYLVRGSTWVTYDDTESYCEKLNWMRYKGYAGAMLWSIDIDDHHNLCGLGTYPLINYIKNNWGTSLSCTSGPSSLPPDATVPSGGGGDGDGSVGSSGDPDCTNHLDGSLFAHPTDCTKYYQCDTAGVKYTLSCQDGLLFHPVLLYCDWPENVVCGSSDAVTNAPATAAPATAAPATVAPPATALPTTAAPATAAPATQAPSGGSASCTGHLDEQPFVDTASCTHFYKCTPEGDLSRQECPSGLYFSPTNLYCDWPENVACGTGGSGGSVTTMASRTAALTTTAPATNAPTTTAPTTAAPTTAGPTTAAPTTTAPATQAPPSGGSATCTGHLDEQPFVDTASCTHFYKCTPEGDLSQQECPSGLYFSHTNHYCDWPENVACGTRGSGGSVTTMAPATAALTTEAPATNAPTTTALTTAAPTTAAPTTAAPTTTAPATQAPPSGGSATCTGHLDGQPFVDTVSCTHFYKCTPEGDLSRQECPSGLYFSPTNHYCDWPENVACGTGGSGGSVTTMAPATAAPTTEAPATNAPTTTAPTTTAPATQAPPSGGSATCTGHLDGQPFEDTASCTHFYKCTPEGDKSHHECPSGLYFSPINRYCDWPENVACSGVAPGGTVVDPECEGHLDGLAFADTTHCASYLTCAADGTKSTGWCGINLYFSDVLGYCDYTYNVNCGSRPQTNL